MRHYIIILIFTWCTMLLSPSCIADNQIKNSAPTSTIKRNNASPTNIAADTLSLFFAGDIMPGTIYPQNFLPSNNGKNLFDQVAPLLSNADFAVGNLEGALTSDISTPKKCSNPSLCYAFAIPPSYASLFKDAGFDALAITNNHANDFGPKGAASTRNTLNKEGIPFAGSLADAEYKIVNKNGIKYALAAFSTSPGAPSINDISNARRIVGEARKNADIVIVSFHGGAEGAGATRVTGRQEIFHGEKRGNVKDFARACVDAGADIVFGHGPHVARAIELYNGKAIAYSLGNFCTPYRINLNGICGYAPLLEIKIDNNGNFISGKIHSFIQQKGIGPQNDPTFKVAKEISRLSKLDFPDSPLIFHNDGSITINK